MSCLLWGPPGSGKTTLARLLAEAVDARFVPISAVSSGVRDLRASIDDAHRRTAEGAAPTVLFVDEIHRFNKAQQDALLHAVEAGDVIFIGATTENPSFEVIPPLRSRARTFMLEPLGIDDLRGILTAAMERDPEISALTVDIDDSDALLAFSGGDARSLLNGFEMCCVLADDGSGHVSITRNVMEEAFQRSFARYDKGGEEHYNVISAFIKSVRGSDPDAALYWLARMLQGGEDPLFIARRLIVLASEDIGNAEPNALLLAVACFQAVHAIGLPEARIVLGHATTYLACAPKSNAAYLAIEQAVADTNARPPYGVPLHLRNAPTTFMKSVGYGKGYLYPHDHPDHLVAQEYLPPEMMDRKYYEPSDQGREKTIRERLDAIRQRLHARQAPRRRRDSPPSDS